MEGMIYRYGFQNEKARAQIERELANDRAAWAGRLFPDRVGHRPVLPRAKYSGAGRGSAANSAVCYALGITAVDPVGMDLLFERFLSEERGEWPDIDLDLPSGDQRERAIQYVYERYGKLGAAMTANVITYRGRSAAREIGKVLSFDSETLDRLTSRGSAWGIQEPRTTRWRGISRGRPRFAASASSQISRTVRQFQDLPRHLGQHSGGMVVCQGQLDSVVPLEPATMPGAWWCSGTRKIARTWAS
jgi:error-prone DNA polymerase